MFFNLVSIVGRFRECPDVHRALGGIILVKAGGLDLYDLDLEKPLVVLHPVCKVLFHSVQIVAIVPPFILPLALFVIVAGPRYIGKSVVSIFMTFPPTSNLSRLWHHASNSV